VEVFSVMRAERSIRRADLCVLVVDLTAGVTAQDKRIAGLIQKERKPCLIVLNKWDLIKPKYKPKAAIAELVDQTRERLFFLRYAPVLVASAIARGHLDRFIRLIEKIRRASRNRIGTGVLNRQLRSAFASNPPPLVGNRRLKLFYATQTGGKPDQHLPPPEFTLFVNDPRLLTDHYARYLETQLRDMHPYPGLPVILTLRPRSEK
jgi:GTP-binding protein